MSSSKRTKIMEQQTNEQIIDWHQCKQILGDHDLAKMTLNAFANSIPTDLKEIRESFDKNEHPQFLKLVHKFHGAVCYCSAERLKHATSTLETALRNKQTDNLQQLLQKVEDESQNFIKAVEDYVKAE